MPLRSRRPRAIRAAVWTAIAFVLGALLLTVSAGTLLAGQEPPTPDAPLTDDQFMVIGDTILQILLGVLALACLPFVLYVDGRTIPRTTLRPTVLAAEKLSEFLTQSGRGGEKFLDGDGSVESLQRRTGGWLPVTLGLFGVGIGTISSLGAFAAAILTITLCARRSWVLCLSALVVAIAAYASGYFITPASYGSFELPVFLLGTVLFSALIVIGVIRGAREQGLIDTAAQTLLRGQSRQERAIAEVRRGIARDMHDSLSHHLSVIAMYSGALSVREDLDPASVRESARLIAESARRSGVELREVLTMLRGDDQGTVVDPELDHLVRGRSDSVELAYTPPLTAASLRGLGALERTTIYRFVQEAITNVLKHAAGSRLTITVGAEAPATLVLVARNPVGPQPTDPRMTDPRTTAVAPHLSPHAGSGLGLLGLRERMEAMGGSLTVSSGPEFVLAARIPAPGLDTMAVDAVCEPVHDRSDEGAPISSTGSLPPSTPTEEPT